MNGRFERDSTARRAALAATVLLTAGAAGCRSSAESPRRAPHPHLFVDPRAPRPNVLLITLDTTRADRLGCYGCASAETPALDGLARRGVLFRNAMAAVPMTLPSHATILTGANPPEHGLRVNGPEALGPELPTLAERFRAAGFATGAIIGAFVLNHRFGLARGFDTYDDALPPPADPAAVHPLEQQRTAEQVTERVLAWLAAHADRPFFCWAHYYDPHDPYTPPAAFRERHRHPYDGELAYVDAQVQRVLDFLEARDLGGRTLVVVAGDHGESLDEHGEANHGMFVYEAVIRVPLIFSMPGTLPAGRQTADLVGLCDLYPTLMDLNGWDVTKRISGRSLEPALLGGALAEASYYAEAQYPYLSFGWSPLRSVLRGPWRYVAAPRPELYDRLADPQEQHNLFERRAGVAGQLEDELARLEAAMTAYAPQAAEFDSQQRRALESLGYLTPASRTSTTAPSVRLKDPKDMLDVIRACARAYELKTQGRLRMALELLEAARAQSPESAVIHQQIAELCIATRRFDRARQALEQCLRMQPPTAGLLSDLGNVYLELGRTREAIERYTAALALRPDDAAVRLNLAQAFLQQGDRAAARGQWQEAARHYRVVLKSDPADLVSRQGLADALIELARYDEAIEQYRGVVAGRPADPDARLRLHRALLLRGRYAEARANLEEALAHGRHDAALANGLAWLLATCPDDAVRDGSAALRWARAALEWQGEPTPGLRDTLAAAQAEDRDLRAACETAARAAESARQQGDSDLADRIDRRLALYRRGRPFREAPATTQPDAPGPTSAP